VDTFPSIKLPSLMDSTFDTCFEGRTHKVSKNGTHPKKIIETIILGIENFNIRLRERVAIIS
jgi:hypothetical protein